MRELTARETEIVEEFRSMLQLAMKHVLAEARLQRDREWLEFWKEMRDEQKLTNAILRGELSHE